MPDAPRHRPADHRVSGTTARYVRTSQYEVLHGHRYDAKARTVDGEFRVYAVYLGPA